MINNEKKFVEISIKNLRLRTIIGINKSERKSIQDIIINIKYKYNALKSIEEDDISYSVNYKNITKKIIAAVEKSDFYLLESLANLIYNIVSEDSTIQNVDVTVEKPFALRFSDTVVARISDYEDNKKTNNIVTIGLGSNINPEQNIASAKKELGNICNILKESDFAYTKPLLHSEQDDFLNGALLTLTTLDFDTLRTQLKKIEIKLGRIKSENKNGPRTIDLDILIYNDIVTDNDIYKRDFLKNSILELMPN
ncbi:MAG: 2-amino-4-hydroxy-6-hydroxymethyldihydropteridine diphosphokinase, partial [Candidatus Electrothrix sp. AR3]|nr:2-amino-4-hydroxy-6-hydroxymethyldihydropteridine diphosphokinase [Candidatus Electrothrix sp. AR3]